MMYCFYNVHLDKKGEEARETAQWLAPSLAEDLGLGALTYIVTHHNLSLQFHTVLHLLSVSADIKHP